MGIVFFLVFPFLLLLQATLIISLLCFYNGVLIANQCQQATWMSVFSLKHCLGMLLTTICVCVLRKRADRLRDFVFSVKKPLAWSLFSLIVTWHWRRKWNVSNTVRIIWHLKCTVIWEQMCQHKCRLATDREKQNLPLARSKNKAWILCPVPLIIVHKICAFVKFKLIHWLVSSVFHWENEK